MIVLGITDSFTSGAAMVIDGLLVAAVNEERLDRNKMSMGFPRLSIREVLRLADVRAADIDVVAVATNHLFWRPEAVPYLDYFRETKGGKRDAFLRLGAAFSTVAGNSAAARRAYYWLKSQMTRERRKALPEALKTEYGIEAPIAFLDHHLCHAASAYFTSGFEEATVITQDGAGDAKCSRVYKVERGRFEPLHQLDSYHSVGNYYSYVTHLCGFKAHKHEGKITGLAAYGKNSFVPLLERYVKYQEGDILNIGQCFDHSAIEKLEKVLGPEFSHEDLSASIQYVLEETVKRYCGHWVKQSGAAKLALAGGVFANVKLNQRVHELKGVDEIFVHPGMGDDGLAVGAALFTHSQKAGYQHRPMIDTVYLGGDITGADALREIRNAGLDIVCEKEGLELAVAKLLAAGRVVARAAGKMEYGPRALGNRTIMYQATDPSVNKWLNEHLSRTEFMPFAPVTLWEEREKCYKDIHGAEQAARFMTVTFDCLDEMKAKCPAVCHVDGTARPQLIRESDNPSYYKIVKEYAALTGLPSVINTSFNMHEEPIVNTAADAVKAYRQGHLDYLVLGPYLVRHPQGR